MFYLSLDLYIRDGTREQIYFRVNSRFIWYYSNYFCFGQGQVHLLRDCIFYFLCVLFQIWGMGRKMLSNSGMSHKTEFMGYVMKFPTNSLGGSSKLARCHLSLHLHHWPAVGSAWHDKVKPTCSCRGPTDWQGSGTDKSCSSREMPSH